MKNEALDALINEALDHREVYAHVSPAELGWTDAGAMTITFSDGAAAEFAPSFLRAVCPCAECRGTHGTPPKAFNIVTATKLAGAAQQTVIRKIEPMGHYALAITWGDGHKEGIYTWAYLRGLAQQQQQR